MSVEFEFIKSYWLFIAAFATSAAFILRDRWRIDRIEKEMESDAMKIKERFAQYDERLDEFSEKVLSAIEKLGTKAELDNRALQARLEGDIQGLKKDNRDDLKNVYGKLESMKDDIAKMNINIVNAIHASKSSNPHQ